MWFYTASCHHWLKHERKVRLTVVRASVPSGGLGRSPTPQGGRLPLHGVGMASGTAHCRSLASRQAAAAQSSPSLPFLAAAPTGTPLSCPCRALTQQVRPGPLRHFPSEIPGCLQITSTPTSKWPLPPNRGAGREERAAEGHQSWCRSCRVGIAPLCPPRSRSGGPARPGRSQRQRWSTVRCARLSPWAQHPSLHTLGSRSLPPALTPGVAIRVLPQKTAPNLAAWLVSLGKDTLTSARQTSEASGL